MFATFRSVLYQEYLVEKLKSCCRSMTMVSVREFCEEKIDWKERLQNVEVDQNSECRMILDERITVRFISKFIILNLWHVIYDKWYISYMMTYVKFRMWIEWILSSIIHRAVIFVLCYIVYSILLDMYKCIYT